MTLEDHAKEIALRLITKLTNNPKDVAIYQTAFGFDVKCIIDNGLIYYYFTGMPNELTVMIGSIFETFNNMLKEKALAKAKTQQQQPMKHNKKHKRKKNH